MSDPVQRNRIGVKGDPTPDHQYGDLDRRDRPAHVAPHDEQDETGASVVVTYCIHNRAGHPVARTSDPHAAEQASREGLHVTATVQGVDR